MRPPPDPPPDDIGFSTGPGIAKCPARVVVRCARQSVGGARSLFLLAPFDRMPLRSGAGMIPDGFSSPSRTIPNIPRRISRTLRCREVAATPTRDRRWMAAASFSERGRGKETVDSDDSATIQSGLVALLRDESALGRSTAGMPVPSLCRAESWCSAASSRGLTLTARPCCGLGRRLPPVPGCQRCLRRVL